MHSLVDIFRTLDFISMWIWIWLEGVSKKRERRKRTRVSQSNLVLLPTWPSLDAPSLHSKNQTTFTPFIFFNFFYIDFFQTASNQLVNFKSNPSPNNPSEKLLSLFPLLPQRQREQDGWFDCNSNGSANPLQGWSHWRNDFQIVSIRFIEM